MEVHIDYKSKKYDDKDKLRIADEAERIFYGKQLKECEKKPRACVVTPRFNPE